MVIIYTTWGSLWGAHCGLIVDPTSCHGGRLKPPRQGGEDHVVRGDVVRGGDGRGAREGGRERTRTRAGGDTSASKRPPEAGDTPKPTKDPRGMGAVNEKTRVGTAVRDGEKHVWGYHQESETRSRVAKSNLKGTFFRAPLQCCGAPTPRGVPREK